jgi:AAA+ ATPase superfamily predicted ATPase
VQGVALFVNRVEELAYLKRLSREGGARLLIVYGRRRIGKTELLRHFSKDLKHLFFSADLSSEHEQLRQITDRIYHLTGESFLEAQPFTSWEASFRYIFDNLAKNIPIIIIDEFPYLCTGNPALPSILQKIWDERGKDTSVLLVLCGSYMSFMEKEILGSKSPLFGRRTGQLLLPPLRFGDLGDFYPNYVKTDLVYAYGILGGTPAYLQRFNDQMTLEQNVKSQILDKNSVLYSEPRFLLMEELREPSVYFSILKAVSFGKTKLNEIVQETGIPDRHKVNKYLAVLRELHIVNREVPVTEDKPYKSRKGIYTLEDPFFRFWFRHIFPNMSYLEEGDCDYVWAEKIKPDLDRFVGPVFEDVCKEKIRYLNKEGKLPFKASRIGRWWDRMNEIDIIAFGEQGSYLFCECKWTTKKSGTGVLNDLQEKAQSFPKATRKFFGLFSRSGFEKKLIEEVSTRDDVFLFDY